MTSKMDIAVSALIRKVSAAVVMPRYLNLCAGQISEKSLGEVVTIADHEAEDALREGLQHLDSSARIVGEEAASADPSLMDGIDQGAVWLIDPVDGTKNFARGEGPFGMMVAFVVAGVTQGAWLYCPRSDRMCHAARAEGAWINGAQVSIASNTSRRPIAALATQFLPKEMQRSVVASAQRECDLVPIPGCAAEHYPRLVLGTYDISLFQRTYAWDHAAGALFLEEAGGKVARWDGSDYRIGDKGFGLLVASDEARWEAAARLLFNSETGLQASFEGWPM